MENVKGKEERLAKEEKNLPEYESPKVITYSGDELLARLGPAQACSPFGGAVIGCD